MMKDCFTLKILHNLIKSLSFNRNFEISVLKEVYYNGKYQSGIQFQYKLHCMYTRRVTGSTHHFSYSPTLQRQNSTHYQFINISTNERET